jgi:hypothetical protein
MKGGRAMKRNDSIGKKGLYIGAAVGLVLFAVIGLLPSSFIGGVLGLKIAGHIFGTPLGVAVLPRMVVGLSMLLGILITGLIFVVGLSLAGWLCGHVIDAVRASKSAPAELAPEKNRAEG